MTSTKPRFEIHADTRLIYQRLIETKPGETVTYADLSATISRPVTGNCYNLQSAIRMARRDDAIYFDNVSKVGYRRMTATDIVSSGPDDIGRVRRIAKRSVEKQLSAPAEDLTPESRRVQLGTLGVFGALTQFTTKKAIALVEDAAGKAGKEIPVAETLRLFAK
jgi:hypothetical protein